MKTFCMLTVKRIQALSKNEIVDLIPYDTFQAIKLKDEHPLFQAWSICHEGLSTPTLLGDTAKPISWTRKAIQSIKNIVVKGIKFFMGHNADNSTEGRKVMGEVIANTEKEIDGKLHHIVIAYHPSNVQEEIKNCDVCSQEAEWNFFEEAGNLIAHSIENLTGIALACSDKEKPAFAGAKRLGMVQAFENQEKTGEPVKEKTMNLNEVIQAVKDLNIHPSQLFTLDGIKADHNFYPVFAKIETLEKDGKTKDDKIKVLEDQNKETLKTTEKITAKNRFEEFVKQAEGGKLTDKQKEFVIARFNVDTTDLSDASLKSFIAQKLDDFKFAAKMFDPVKSKDSGNPDPKNQTKVGDPDDLTKAANNPWLSEDLNAGKE